MVLEGFYGFYAIWEKAVAERIDALLLRYTEAPQVPMLEQDLAFFRSDLTGVPECPTLPNTASVQSVWGSLYVLEGATLGGQVCSQPFFQAIWPLQLRRLYFLSSYG